MRKIGFIGLGVMGGPMAGHLAAKHGNVTGFDVDESRTRTAAVGIEIAKSTAEVGRSADVVFLSLPGSAIVKEVLLGSGGVLDAMREGSIVVDTSTTEPNVTAQVSRALGERGVRFLDAPVSGGEKAAVDGTLSFMVGGEASVFDDCLDLLKCMGASVVHVGDIGAGEVAKLINNMIVGATFAIVAESFALGVKSGLDPKVLYEAIRNGWAGSKVLDVSITDMLSREFKPGGTVNIHWKDLGYALSLSKDTDVPTPVTALVHEIFKAARASGKGSMSQPAVVTLWEELLGVEVK